jgi:hypothetical protein
MDCRDKIIDELLSATSDLYFVIMAQRDGSMSEADIDRHLQAVALALTEARLARAKMREQR